MTTSTITYVKLRDGSWGLRGAALTAGETVTVTKRDGSTKQETVGRILATVRGFTLATIAAGGGRAAWKGQLAFGEVRIGISAYAAYDDPPQGPELRQLHDACRKPIEQRRLCTKCVDGKGQPLEVPYANLVKGHEHTPGEMMITVTQAELDAIKPASSRIITLHRFVLRLAIDQRYFDTAYHLVPSDAAAPAPFVMLRQALLETDTVGIGTIGLHGHEHLVAVQPDGRGLGMHRLRELREIRTIIAVSGYDRIPETADPQFVAVAKQIIERQRGPFDPTLAEDGYRVRFEQLIAAKVRGEVMESDVPTAAAAAADLDLMAALEATRAALKTSAPKPTDTRTSRPESKTRSRKAVA
jgi:DNA end-binding protein Ku